MKVTDVFPMLVAQNIQQTKYDGIISVMNHDYIISVLYEEESVENRALSIDCDWNLSQLLKDHRDVLSQRLKQSSNLPEFLLELKNMIERQLQGKISHSKKSETKYYSNLLDEINILGWQRLAYVDPTFKELHLQAKDRKNRNHVIKINLESRIPYQTVDCTTELPIHYEFSWNPERGLQNLIGQFEVCLEQVQDFWDMMDNIDQNTWILEPEKPTRNAIYRRIALGNNASIHIEVNPKYPRAVPECRFLGSDHVINPIKENFNTNLHCWDHSKYLLENLQNILQITFPSPSNSKKEDFSVACGICYAYRLENEIPDQLCDETRCAQPFHQTCLYEWLRSNSSSRQSFNTVFGECPYCSKAITVKMPSKR